MDPQLEQLLDQYQEYLEVQENGKIKCIINGHQLAPRYDVVSAFVK